jgi:hypothetical protein
MKRLIIFAIPLSVLFIALFITSAAASQCPESIIKAMKDEGLSESQIKSICAKAESYAKKKPSVFTPEKIEQDLMGMTIGPEAGVIVETRPGRPSGAAPKSRSAPHSGQSYDAIVSVPMGIVFDETNIQGIKVLDTKITGNKTQVVAHVETISSYAGKLRLYYELIAGEWILMEIENLNFRQQ